MTAVAGGKHYVNAGHTSYKEQKSNFFFGTLYVYLSLKDS